MTIGAHISVPQMPTEEARVRLREWMLRTGRSQSDAARSLGISPAALNQWLNAKYNGDAGGITAKVCSLLAVEAERAEARRALDFVMTRVASDVLEACRWAHVHRDIAVVYGEAGMGKTVALRRYRGEHRDSVYMRCDPSCRSPLATLAVLATALGRKPKWGSLRALIDEMVDVLEGSGRLLMFDEANFLSLRSLEVLRAVHDNAGIGMVLCGNYDVYTQMHGEGRAAFAQLFSRVGLRRMVRLGLSQEDVVALTRSIVGDLGEDCVTYLGEKAAEPGGVRRMVKVLRLGCELAAGDQVAVPALKHLKLAETMLMGSAG